jgi:predicted metalloprotease
MRGMSGGRIGMGAAAGGGVIGLVVLLLNLFTTGGGGGGSGSIGDVLGQLGGVPAAEPGATTLPPTEESQFVTFLTEDVQALWDQEFTDTGRQYQYARVNMFTDQVQTGCGVASSAVGPFYCPADSEVYIDLGFFQELSTRFGAPGDFAQAYVIAHEFGHHVQNLLGISDQVHQEEQNAGSEADANEWSVKLELQADCLAGVWAHSVYARGDLEAGDIEEGLAAAEGVGDDRIQSQAGVDVNPETWTHGSSAQRQEWFDRGFDSGRSDDCDTFA